MHDLSPASQKAIYLLSDLHLGAPDPARSLIREKHVVRWLESIASDAQALYLVGDVFDFWFEYRHAIPKGYIRFLGQLARMRDAGIDLYIFSGNHDLWYKDYLIQQLDATIYHAPIIRELHGQTYYLAHGDGLGPGDHGYKLMKRVVTHPLARWLFGRLHPNFGIGLANWLSQNGGNHNYIHPVPDHDFVCTEEDHLMIHARQTLAAHPEIDHFVFGHRHKVVDQPLDDKRRIFILGDWIQYFTFIRVSAEGPELRNYPLTEEAQLAPS